MTGMLIKNTARHPNPSTSLAARASGRRGERASRTPDPDRHLVPSGRGGGEDEGETRRRLQCAAGRLDDAGADQHLAGHGETGQHGTEQEDRHAGQEDPFVAVALQNQPPIRKRLATPML